MPESSKTDPPSGDECYRGDAFDDGSPPSVGAEPGELLEVETDPSRTGSDPLVEHFPDEGRFALFEVNVRFTGVRGATKA